MSKKKIIMDDELKELFRELEEQGWEPMLCDTPVPYFDNKVMCGVPNGIGDIVAEEMLIPKRWASIDGLFITTVQGDSMIDANIVEGDRIFVEETNAYNDGDILLVSIDGEYTLKSYCKDEDGNPWLIPQNAAYRAFQLHEHENVRVRGVVRMVIKESPQVNFRSCQKKIKAAKQSEKKKTVTMEQVEGVIMRIAPEIKVSRHWYAVFRALVDMKVYKAEDISLFVNLLYRLVPNHEHLTTADDLQRMAVDSFAKPVLLWDENNAPVPAGKRFMDYKKIAEKTALYIEES